MTGHKSKLATLLFEATVIFCCAPSTKPLFPHSYVKSEMTQMTCISLIGSCNPYMQEVDTELILSGNMFIVDNKEACLKEARELIMANLTNEELVED